MWPVNEAIYRTQWAAAPQTDMADMVSSHIVLVRFVDLREMTAALHPETWEEIIRAVVNINVIKFDSEGITAVFVKWKASVFRFHYLFVIDGNWIN